MAQKTPIYGRDLMFELAIAKGVTYDRDSRKPTKRQVVLALEKKGIRNSNQVLYIIQKLKRRIKLENLQKKARDLGVLSENIIDNAFKLAIHIYVKDQKALEDLSRFQRSEPRKRSVYFTSQLQLTLEDWISKEPQLRKLVEQRLSDKELDSIATLDKITSLGNSVRCEIGFDKKKRIVERNKSPQFPNREGSYDAYPLKRIVVTYDLEKQVMQVSSYPDKTPLLMEAFSEGLAGSDGNFKVRKPSPTKILY